METSTTAAEAYACMAKQFSTQCAAVSALLNKALENATEHGTTGVGPQGTIQIPVAHSIYGSADEIEKLSRAQLHLMQTLGLLRK